MAYDGWVEFNGVEVINLSRTAQLADVLGIDTVWTDPASVQWIQDALGGVDYDVPSTAPWYDPDYPASAEFAGLVPLSLTGLDDSTLESTTVEYITDGGHSGRPRNKSLTVVANVAVVASTDRGAEYGKRWLDRTLRKGASNMFCSGADLRYFRYPGDDETLTAPPLAHRRNVSLTRGTSVTRKRGTSCSVTWLTTFTWTAADPYEYGEPVTVLADLGGVPMESGDNILPNPLAIEPWTINSGTGGATTQVNEPNGGWNGYPFKKVTWTTAPTAGNPGIAVTPLVIPVSGNTRISVGMMVRHISAGTKTINLRVDFYGDSGYISGVNTLGTQSPVSGDWGHLKIENILTPAGTTSIRFFLRWLALPDIGDELNATAATVVLGETLPEILPQSGLYPLVQESCPVYDYSPVYDPLYPALVPPPAAPDFYPDGWNIEDGMTFNRYWARVDPVEPSSLNVVPIITLTSDVDARMVRVSIWDSTASANDQCDPLFSVVVSYLPAGKQFVIDGQQQASYVWDGFSPAVHRADSLVYGPTARPVDWTAFNDDMNLLVTLDLFTEAGVEQGNGTARAALQLVPKSD